MGELMSLIEDEKKQIRYFNRMKSVLSRRFAGKVIAIANGEVAGVGVSEEEALAQARRKYPKRAVYVVSFSEGDLLVHGII